MWIECERIYIQEVFKQRWCCQSNSTSTQLNTSWKWQGTWLEPCTLPNIRLIHLQLNLLIFVVEPFLNQTRRNMMRKMYVAWPPSLPCVGTQSLIPPPTSAEFFCAHDFNYSGVTHSTLPPFWSLAITGINVLSVKTN